MDSNSNHARPAHRPHPGTIIESMRAELHGAEGAVGATGSKRPAADGDEEMEDMETPAKPAGGRRRKS